MIVWLLKAADLAERQQCCVKYAKRRHSMAITIFHRSLFQTNRL